MSNEQMVEWVYKRLNDGKDLKSTVAELLNETIAPSVEENQGIGCDNMSAILIKFKK
jgi:hypothetical protein